MASNNVIQGNYIGTDITGTSALTNSIAGIGISNAGGNLISARNIISGNDANGIYIAGNGAFGNVIQGNFIGTDVTGMIGLPNGRALPVLDGAGGIQISGAPGNMIGGKDPGAGNVISANMRDAIFIGNAGA